MMINDLFNGRLCCMKLSFKIAPILLLLFSYSVQASSKLALLVGVSNYYHLPTAQLEGPANDAKLVNQMLLARGFNQSNITRLISSGSKNRDNEPTRSNILASLSKLAKVSKNNDFVYLHFAGHGSRQPAKEKNNDETDGLDEIFLPADSKKWNSYIGSVENAISDNEIALFIDKIRSKGANVWVVFDSCHSGSMTRGIGQPTVRYRKILNKDLGIPSVKIEKRTGHSRGYDTIALSDTPFLPMVTSDSIKINKNKGDLIAFSAAQSEQTTPEMHLPSGSVNSRSHGLFSYTLVDVLSKNRGISYKQLAQELMSRYQSIPWHNSTPLISATNMNARL